MQAVTRDFGPGLHHAAGRPVDASAYDQYVGRWSRAFVPAVLAAAGVRTGSRVLDVATGTGEAALAAVPIVEPAGIVIGADISPAMLRVVRARLDDRSFRAVMTDGQALSVRDDSMDAVVCQLGLQFFRDPTLGLSEFKRVLRAGGRAAVCVISTPERAPMWGILAGALSRHLPDEREALHLSFALADPARLEQLLLTAGFHDVSVTRASHEEVTESFRDYWAPIEAGTGQIPQAYLRLPESVRRAVREEVRVGLAQFEWDGRLVMTVEMLIGVGCA
jgi:ubiquinone/menaquinone biosynthesis C-methylase UbiE